MRIERLFDRPIITPGMHSGLDNINGPSLIRAPDWLPSPLGRYYLYFAHHQGTSIRLAVADRLAGPWRLHQPGTLQLAQTQYAGHIASPDVHLDHVRHEVLMFFHGSPLPDEPRQATQLAISANGIDFTVREPVLGDPYWRLWTWDGWWYALVMPGLFCRARDPRGAFESGPRLFTEDMRHAAVRLVGHTLQVFYSNAHDCPEHILMSTIDPRPDWWEWEASPPVSVLRPERDYEGANEPCQPSRRGSVHGPAHQLRDPGIFQEDGRTFLLYSVAGEHGLAIAEIFDEDRG